MAEKSVSFKNKKGEKLSGYLHVPEKKYKYGIILTHCFTCSKHVRVIRKMCDYLAELGFLTLRFDFSGNGESEGKFSESTYTKQISDYNSAIDFLLKQKVKCLGSLGHSMGAAIEILAGTKNKNVKALTTLGGDSSTQGIENVFDKKILNDIKAKGKCTFTLFGREVTLTKDFFKDAKKHSISECLKHSTKPILIVHGDKDEIVNVDNAKKLYFYSNEPKELRIIPGGDHMFTNDLEETLDLAGKWFKQHLR